MPNGHGGRPYFGGPIVLAILFAILASTSSGNESWIAWARVGICVIVAAAFGWRVAYYIHLRDADAYGGAYTQPEIYKHARRRYWIAALVYAVLAAATGFGILYWRGLP